MIRSSLKKRVKRKNKKQIGSGKTVVGAKVFKEKKETKDKEQSREKEGNVTTAYSKQSKRKKEEATRFVASSFF